MKKRISLVLLAAMLVLLAACAAKNAQESKNYYLGDEISTEFFDYTPKSAEAASSYSGYTPDKDNQLILVDMTIQNTQTYSMPMSRYDFQIQWGDGDTDFACPLEQFCDEQLPDEYDIPIGGNEEGVLVFEVPKDREDFSLSFLEVYEDNSEGDVFFTYFTV